MNLFRIMLLSTAAIGLCAGAVPAQDRTKAPPRPEEVIRVLEKVRAQLAEKDLTVEQRMKLAEVLARTTEQIEAAVDRDAERRDRERDIERDAVREMRERQREMESVRRDLERQRAEMEREMVQHQRELDRAREQFERELVKREAGQHQIRAELERAQAENAEVRDHAEHVRRQAVEDLADVYRDLEHARKAEQEAMERARQAPGDDPNPLRFFARSKDGKEVKGRVLRLDDVTEAAEFDKPRGIWVVKPGDTVLRIAKETTGDARGVRAIVEANPGIDPRRLQVGRRVRVPTPPKAPEAPKAPTRIQFFPGATLPPYAPFVPPAPAPLPLEHHVHTHVHHHYDGVAPAPKAVSVPRVAPAPKAEPRPSVGVFFSGRNAAPAAKARATRVGTPATQVRAAAARADDIRAMVEGLRRELRETRAMVEDLRKKLTASDVPAGRIH